MPHHVEAEPFAADQMNMAMQLGLEPVVPEVGNGPVPIGTLLATKLDSKLPYTSQQVAARP